MTLLYWIANDGAGRICSASFFELVDPLRATECIWMVPGTIDPED